GRRRRAPPAAGHPPGVHRGRLPLLGRGALV
ncbi:MAG: hypothetical protein AVDCRST_MAG35-1639, partial [uncultured Quadrisphaera sp.]